MNYVQASLLAQTRPSSTSATSAFSSILATTITRIHITNTTGSAAAASVYHDDDGTTFDQTTALLYSKSIAANTSETIEAASLDSGITVAAGGAIGVRSQTPSALTFSLYGVTRAGRGA